MHKYVEVIIRFNRRDKHDVTDVVFCIWTCINMTKCYAGKRKYNFGIYFGHFLQNILFFIKQTFNRTNRFHAHRFQAWIIKHWFIVHETFKLLEAFLTVWQLSLFMHADNIWCWKSLPEMKLIDEGYIILCTVNICI